MMQVYPKIYMLSTVGIRQHYHQDYPIHILRTDFAGKNAIGKSIIADLLQLIFIQDRSIIHFGTDSLYSNSRKIETIPYKHNQGYSYLTIEVVKDRFIAIGVCIPNSTNNPIIPFIISKHENINNGSIESISFSKEELIKSNHFLYEGAVLPIQDLSKYIRDKYNLRLIYFRGKSEIRQYQLFLKERKILPVNLTNESDLKSFARILQSFSRAKDFKPSDPKKLKDFLFDEVAEEYLRDFRLHKSELETQLNNYKELNEANEHLSLKRNQLQTLKKFEKNKINAELMFFNAELLAISEELITHNEKIISTSQSITQKKIESKSLSDSIKKLEDKLIPLSKKLEDKALQYCLQLAKCTDLKSNLDDLNIDYKQLQEVKLPNLDNFLIDDEIKIDELSIPALIHRNKSVSLKLKEFTSLKEIEDKVYTQERLIEENSSQIDQQIAQANNLLQIVKNNKGNTLFSKVLESGLILTPEQESVLFHLIDVKWERPNNIDSDTRFVTDLSVLNSNLIINEPSLTNKIWFTNGYINQLIKIKEKPHLFNNKETLLTARASMQNQIEDELKYLNDIKSELLKAKEGKPYDQVKLQHNIDIQYVNQEQLKEIKKDIKIIKTIPARINDIQNKKESIALQFRERMGNEFDPNLLNDLDIEIETWNNIRENRNKRIEKLVETFNKSDSRLNNITRILTNLQEELLTLEKQSQTIFNIESEKRIEFHSYCSLVGIGQFQLEQLTNEKVDFEKIRSDFLDKKRLYAKEYENLAHPYTQNNTPLFNAEIKEQVLNETYNFSILESIMLNKIGLLEDVESYISGLNKQRMECRRIIYEQIKGLFEKTSESYKKHKRLVRDLDIFFRDKSINKVYTFTIEFEDISLSDGMPMVSWLNQIQRESASVFEEGELQLGQSVDVFVESFYKKLSKESKIRPIRELLDPKSYFTLKTRLLDKNGIEASGSTGQTYTSIILLCIGRISIIDKDKEGIKFVILEEIASIDDENFELVMQIASDFSYQIITMTPKPYAITTSSEWYLHQLIEGNEDRYINYPMTASYLRSSITNNVI